MVICQGQLDSVVPLEPATMPGRVVVQWDKEDCADMGIVKVDLLGLGMMAVLEDSIDADSRSLRRGGRSRESACRRSGSVSTRCRRPTRSACFRSRAARRCRACRDCVPTRFYDIVVQVAIIRPGPIVGKMVNPYLMRRQGREPVAYPHPVARTCAGAHAGRAAVSGTTVAHGDDCRRISAEAKRKSCGARSASSVARSACAISR